MVHDLPPLPARPPDGHKGTFGTVCVVGGQAAAAPGRVMLGSPAFAALGALRVGAGLAVLAVPEPIVNEALTIAPSATGLALPVDSASTLNPSETAAILDQYLHAMKCMAIGPGLGVGRAQQQIVLRLIAQADVPLVIDADGLNNLAEAADFHRDLRAQAVLTPHPGEYARLAAALGIVADATHDASRTDAALQLAQRLGCVVVLKGRHTVLSDGVQSWTCTAGNVSLATAGSGDVLTGVIAGFIAQFFKPHLGSDSNQISPERQGGFSLFDCARWGVQIHAQAADRWAAAHGQAGLLATDLLELLPDVLAESRRAHEKKT